MEIFLIVFGLVLLIVVGNAMILLSTAKKPKIPDSVKAKLDEGDESGW